MKKTTLKIACTTCFTLATGVAQAQSSVTLSGILDAGFEVNQAGALKTDPSQHPTNYRFQNGDLQASRLMFSGTEDMGGGLKTLFHLETQFNLGTGAYAGGTGGFTREAWLALDSNEGTLTAGRYRMPIFWVYLGSDASTYRLDSFTPLNIMHQAVLAPVFGKQTTTTTLAGAYTGLGGFSNNTID